MRPSAGQNFGGRYVLESRIAVGGMGEVWQATDTVIGRQVAIKILKDEFLGDPGFLERFRGEARHAALVNHEGIANVYDYGEEEGSAYLVMELVPGEPLSAILERDGALSIDKTLDIVGQTAAALSAAHAAGLVHRDIKPGNMLITPEGRVKLTDFGIARIADQVPLTATGQVMGTVQYLSPEQASGQAASPATDIYSLGIVAYECLAGKRPFTGESQVAIAMAQINDAPPPLPDTIAEPVRNLIMSCIAKDPAQRPESTALLARACTALRRGDVAGAATAVPAILAGASAEDETMVMPRTAATGATTVLSLSESADATPHPKKRNPWTWPLVALGGVLLIVIVGSIIALVSGGNPAPPPTTSGTQTSSPTKTSSPTRTPTKSPTVTPTPTPTAGTIPDLAGRNVDDAVAQLNSLGYKNVNKFSVGPATSPAKAFTVPTNGVSPAGANVPFTETITVKYYDDVPVMPTPGVATMVAPPAGGGASFTVSWPAYSCPASFALQGYTFTFNGVESRFDASTTSFAFVAPAGSGSYPMTYKATCAEVTSASSPALSVVVP